MAAPPSKARTRLPALKGSEWMSSSNAETAFKALKGELTAGSEGEVSAVAGLRNVLVALGPFYIKLGQALSIRPDILSPQAMVQLQQLCDKVPPCGLDERDGTRPPPLVTSLVTSLGGLPLGAAV